jgi:phenylacetate-CoA ligase
MAILAAHVKSQFKLAEERTAWLSSVTEEEVEEMQWNRVQQLWANAVKRVPCYQKLVASGQAPAELKSWSDFSAIPILDRATLQAQQDNFVCDAPPDQNRMTGGSTGVPVKIGVWKRESDHHRVAKLMLWGKMGYRPSDRLFLIWGHAHLLGTGIQGALNDLLRRLKDRALGYKRVNAYTLSPERCAEIARKLIAFKPVGLIGYASALDYFVRITEKFHRDFARLKLRFVMPAAEVAPRKDSYELLARVFGCPIAEEYAGVEFGQVAMRCDERGFQVFHDLNLVEAVEQPGEPAGKRILITSLYDRYTPLFRYAPGDLIAAPERMAHGHVKSFKTVEGRINDSVQLKSGRVLHSVAVFHCVHQEPSVLNVQLVLRDDGMCVQLVVNEKYTADCERRIRCRLADVAQELRGVSIHLVPDVTTTRAGKRRWIHDERSAIGVLNDAF